MDDEEIIESLRFLRGGLEIIACSQDSREMRAVFRAINKKFKIDESPTDYSSEALADIYLILGDAPQYCEDSSPDYDQRFHQESVVETLGIFEFQAMWHVLRKSHTDQEIGKMDRREQREKFLTTLYDHPEIFGFYEAREKTLNVLAGINFIDLIDYHPETLPRLPAGQR